MRKRGAAPGASSATPAKELPLEDAATAARFETPRAAALALFMFYGFSAGLTHLAMQAAHTTAEGLLTLLWPAAVGLEFIFVLAPGCSLGFARRWTYVLALPIFLLPHLPVCKRGVGKAVGAAQGAAALVLIIRSFSMLHRLEEDVAAKGRWASRWGRWRRVTQGMGLAWHDVDQTVVRALAPGPEHAAHTWALAKELAQYGCWLGASSVLMSLLPPTAAGAVLALRLLLGICCLLAGFNVFDLTWRLLMCATNGLAVQSIIAGSLWNSHTVKDLWLAWNLPVQKLLGRGVYLPLRRRGVPRPAAKLAVFLVSGAGHLWPCFCAGLAWEQLGCMLLFFVAQPLLVAVESALGLRSKAWAIGIEVLFSPLFVVPVLMFTDPTMTG